MSKSKQNNSTRQHILDTAISLFNKHGLEYIGVRELAKEADIKAGHITYYFSTKDDLVLEIARLLGEANNGILAKKPELTMFDFLSMFKKGYENQFRYRALALSLPHLLRQNEQFSKHYIQHQQTRRETIRANIRELISGGFVRSCEKHELAMLEDFTILVSRFWISDHAINQLLEDAPRNRTHYLRLLTNLFRSFATAKGRKEAQAFLESLN